MHVPCYVTIPVQMMPIYTCSDDAAYLYLYASTGVYTAE